MESYGSEVKQVYHHIKMAKFKNDNLLAFLKWKQKSDRGLDGNGCQVLARCFDIGASLERKLSLLDEYLVNFEDGVVLNEI